MTIDAFVNSLATVLDGGIDNSQVTLDVSAGDGAKWDPSGERIVATLIQSPTVFEIIHVTGRASDTLTVTRAQEGTAAISHPDGTALEARITAGLLSRVNPVKNTNGAIGIGEDVSPTATDLIQVGRGSVADTADGVVIGAGAAAAGLNGPVILGKSAAGNNHGDVAIGKNAESAGPTKSVVIGENALADADAGNCVVVGPDAACDGDNSVVVGGDNTVGNQSDRCVVVGEGIDIPASTIDVIAIGNLIEVESDSAVTIALGKNTKAQNAPTSIVQGNAARANAPFSVVLGNRYSGFVAQAAVLPPQVVQREMGLYYNSGGFQAPADRYTSAPVCVAFPPCDLGPGVAWSQTTYNDNDVVVPTSPAGTEQFILVLDAIYELSDGDQMSYNGDIAASNQITESGSEPNWAGATDDGDYVETTAGSGDNNRWTKIDPQSGIIMNVEDLTGDGSAGQVKFYPTRFILACQRYATLTSDPVISFGVVGDVTKYINNQSVAFTASQQIVVQDLAPTNLSPYDAADKLVFTLDTAGVGGGGECLVRPFVQGYYVQLPG